MKRPGRYVALVFVFGLFVAASTAASSFTLTPDSFTSTTPPEEYVKGLYFFALGVGGLLAFGAIVYGAVRYTVSRGNPSGQSDARDQIAQAFLGLLLLLGMYFVLYVVNPGLTSFNLPSLEEIKTPPPAPTPPLTCGAGPACDASKHQVCRLISGVYKCVIIFTTDSECDPNQVPTTCPGGKQCRLKPPTAATYFCQ